jgi:hypothetical protein
MAPVPLSVTIVPEHTSGAGETEVPTVGNGLTVTSTVDVFVQPLAFVPVTVYVVVDTGTNATLSVTPPLQVYEIAPVPFNVMLDPAQTVVPGDAVEETVGSGLTVIVVVAVFTHPFPSVPVTV